MDALAHVSQDGLLHGGIDALAAQTGGRFNELGIDDVAPILSRGILIDVPPALGLDTCEPAYEITVADLEAACERQGVEPAPGDVVFVRSGWGQRWDDAEAYVGASSGVPGVGEAGARWLAGHSPRAVGADTIAFEQIVAGQGHALLPAHRVLLVDAGIHIIETLALEGLAADAIHEFLAVVIPLELVGATGSPVRPLAVVPR
jgi:kynurenine formamidase